jgi:hypothetical protein
VGSSSRLDPAQFLGASTCSVAIDLAQVFIFDIGWVFFATWGMVLAAVSVVAFGRDILPFAQRAAVEVEKERLQALGLRC